MTADWTQNTARLKLLVGIMTALLVAGLILLVVGMVRTASKLSQQETPDAPNPSANRSFGERNFPLPDGERITEMTVGEGRLYLKTEDSQGRQAIYVFDAADARPLGRIVLETTP